MNSTPKVTVVIPFLNDEAFIEEAIESVRSQTFVDWELMLVDDGSTDASTRIARDYAAHFPETIQYWEHPGHQNHGSSASRNLGIRHGRGDYLAFLDADDVWLPHKLEEQVALLDAQPEVAMLYGNTQRWYSWTRRSDDLQRDYLPELGIPLDTVIQPPTLVPLYVRRTVLTPCTCSIIIRREAVERVGGFEDGFHSIYDDQVLYAKLCLRERVYVSSKCWDRYRKHEQSMTTVGKRTGLSNAARGHFLRWLDAYITEQGVTDRELQRSVQHELWPYRHPLLYAVRSFAYQLLFAAKNVGMRALTVARRPLR